MSSEQKVTNTHPLIAFRYRNYRLFWVGNAFSNFGMWALTAGRLWLMHLLTDSTLMLGMVMFFGLGPILVFSMWGGVVADRVNRMKLVVKTRGVIAFLAIVTALLISFEIIEPWHLLLLSFLNGVLLSFDIPSRQAIIPNLVNKEHLMNAIVAQSFVHGAATVLGPFLFAPLMNFLDIECVFYFIGSMYLLTVVFFMCVDVSPHSSNSNNPKKSVFVADLIEGFRYMTARAEILSLMGLGIVVGFFGLSLGTFTVSNSNPGISIIAQSIPDGNNVTNGNSSSVTFNNVFVNPGQGTLLFTSTINSELGHVDIQTFPLCSPLDDNKNSYVFLWFYNVFQ